MSTPPAAPNDALRTLIRANHILHYHGAVDAFGHVSIRHPLSPGHYIMPGYLAPALVASPADLVTYRITNSSAVDPAAQRGYSERFIHGEMYKQFAEVHCVVHSHAQEVLPFAVVGEDSGDDVPLRPIFHMAGFLGARAPVWDIAFAYRQRENDPHYQTQDVSTDARDGGAASQDLLVRSSFLGRSLAHQFGGFSTIPQTTVTLMKRHGFTTWGPDVETAVYRTIYTMANAKALLEAMVLRDLHPKASEDNEGSSHAAAARARAAVDGMALTDQMLQDAKAMNERTQSKAWPLWVREVEVNPLYRLEI